MQYKPQNVLLQTYPDTLQLTLKEYNLDKNGDFENAVMLLKDWVKKQPHFTRSEFSDAYLKATIIEGKGSVEKAKQIIDRLCTLRTLLPQCFESFDLKKEFQRVFDVTYPVILPKLTKQHHRVFVAKINGNVKDSSQITYFFKYGYLFGEYCKACDLVTNFRCVVDFSDINFMDFLTKLNPMDLRHALTIYLEGYGMKIKGIHLVTPSKFIDSLISILKQILKPKLAERISVHKSRDELIDIIGKDVLPKDFGGEEKSLEEIHGDWLKELFSEDFMEYVRQMNTATTNESCRPSSKFNEEYAGLPGTFRVLSVD